MTWKSVVKLFIPPAAMEAYRWLRDHTVRRIWPVTVPLPPVFVNPDGPLTYAQDGLFTRHNADFMQDARFLRAYALGRKAGIYQDSAIHWRAYVALWAARKGRDLPGDFVECGVYRGAMSRMIADYVDLAELKEKKFYLLDTYEGVPAASLTKEELALGRRPGGFEESYAEIQETFRDFPNVVLVRGMIPESLQRVPARQVCYLSIDMNAAAPEIAAAEFFWPKLVSGAVIVLDDYGWATHVVQKHAFDEFAARHGVQVLPLPTGQGLIFKP